MKTKMKALALALCAVMLVATTVFVTVAYLTSTTETVTNTFTVGKVEIRLDEAAVETNGEYVTDIDNRVLENEYHLLPGLSYKKDPTVQVKEGSEDCYVRMIVTVKLPAAASDKIGTDLDGIITGHNTNWVRYNQTISEDKTTIVYEYRYNSIVKVDSLTEKGYKDGFRKLPALFTGITIPGNMEVADLAGLEINVIAHAIQAAGFEAKNGYTAEENAWLAFEDSTQNPAGDANNQDDSTSSEITENA